MGGALDTHNCALSVITRLSTANAKASITQGHEVLEFNNQILRGKTFDQVISLTSGTHSHADVILNPLPRTDSGRFVGEHSKSDHVPRSSSTDIHGRPVKRRMLPRTPVEMKKNQRNVQGEIQIQIGYDASSATLAVTVVSSRRIDLPEDKRQALNHFLILHIVPSRCDHEAIETELGACNTHPELAQTFIFDKFSLNEVMTRSVAFCVWSYDDQGDSFLGEVLVDLMDTDLSDQPKWYPLQDHDENSSPLIRRGHRIMNKRSESLNSGSFHFISPAISPEVPSYLLPQSSPSSLASTTSPVPFSGVGSREFHLNSASQPDTFTTKVRKKMRNTVNKMSSLSLSDRKDCSDESPIMDLQNKAYYKNDKNTTKSYTTARKKQNSKEYSSMDLLCPPKSLSRATSVSSFFLSDDEDSKGRYSISSTTPDRPPPEGDDITSILGPGQIPPKPSAEGTVCGDIKLGFMVSKGQLEVDIICAAGLHKSGRTQEPDTYVKTYLVEGKKVIQRKKTLIVKASFDPVYRKKIKYSACNVHGRIMKVNVWEKFGSFEKKLCRGEVLVKLDGLNLSTHTMAWYKLFEMNATDYGSDEFIHIW